MTHPGTPRDVDLSEWLRGFGFHPANTRIKQLGHEIARQQVANIAGVFHAMLPPGRERTLVFGYLEKALIFSNKALAVGGGPRPVVSDDVAEEVAVLERVLASLRLEGEAFGAVLPQDPRIKEYEEQQRKAPNLHPSLEAAIDAAHADGSIFSDRPGPLDHLPMDVPDVVKEQAAGGLPYQTATSRHGFERFVHTVGGEPGPSWELKLEMVNDETAMATITFHDEGENRRELVEIEITDPDALDNAAAAFAAAAQRVRRQRLGAG